MSSYTIRFFKGLNKTLKNGQNTYGKELSGVLIAVIDSNGSATDADVETDFEVEGLKWHVWAVLLNDYLSLEEGTLWGSRVDLLWLGDQDRSVLKEVVNNELPNSVVFKSALNNWFFEISEKAKNL